MAGLSSTGDASAGSESNAVSEFLGKLKVTKGGGGYGPAMPTYEPHTPLHVIEEAHIHKAVKYLLEEIRKDLWYADPHIKYIPITLDPSVENILRYEGRWYSGIYVQTAQNIIVQPPGLGQVLTTLTTGWNMLNYPEGTRLYAQTVRAPAWIVVANRPIAGTGGGGGGGGTSSTQYSDQSAVPVNPIGNSIVFDNTGTWADVGNDAPLPVGVFSLPSLPAGSNNIGHVTVDNANADGVALSTASSPVVIAIEQNALAAALNGKAYIASTAIQAASGVGNFPLSIFNPTSAHNILIYSIFVSAIGTAATIQANTTVVDPAFGTAGFVNTDSPGGAASLASVSFTTTTQTLPANSTFVGGMRLASNVSQDMLINTRGRLLPKSAANGLSVYFTAGAAGSFIIDIGYVEF